MLQIITHQEAQLKKLGQKLNKLLDELQGKSIDEILALIEKYYEEIEKEMNHYFFMVYRDVNLKVNYRVQTDNMATYPITKNNQDEIMKTITSKFLDKTYKERLDKHKTDLIKRLKQINSVDYSDVAREQEIKRLLKTAQNKLIRLIVTEGDRVINVAIIDAMKDAPYIKKLVYVAILDNRTSTICQKLDGTIINIEDVKQGVNAPPMHAHCRSALLDYDDPNIKAEVEECIKLKTAEPLKIKLSYEEWYKKYGYI